MGLPGPDGRNPRLCHVGWGLEVRLADLEMDHVPTRGFERPGAGEHGERALGAQARDGIRESGVHRACSMGASLRG